ncbi:hypothetical protein QBC35DRAFT_169220 [Podospora australis]|uniref:Uncharacterized protein n=1 Tax=Podospora australis TaxID=1536484 RepID=A0AAN7AE33_9PEZI|nr:hypothetical protein QBC35DRAFT_169220 [Podospora australis]
MGQHLEPDHDDDAVPLIKSPIARVRTIPIEPGVGIQREATAPNLESLGWRDGDNETPEFERHDEATNIEVFYDLFFAANLCIFAEVQDVSNMSQFNTFVAYYVLLWFTWALLGLFDVRFITDSIFERSARALHFGVMVGFAVIAPTFNLDDQKGQTFRTISLILMVSRWTMAAQYMSIFWYVRKFKNAVLPLGLMVGQNVVSALVYLGVAFGFKDGKSPLFSIWYILTGLEIIITVALSLKWQVLSFYGTHLVNRMSLLTYILLGEGIITVLSAATKVVVNNNSWTPPTTGNVAAGVGTLYIVYMIYFDWRRQIRVGVVKQLIWSMLHFPFHLALKLFVLGFTQFVIWWKVIETLLDVQGKFIGVMNASYDPSIKVDSQWFVDQLNATIVGVFTAYTPKYYNTIEVVTGALDYIKAIPEDTWALLESIPEEEALQRPEAQDIIRVIQHLVTAMQNSLLSTFNINGYSGFESFDGEQDELDTLAQQKNWGKFHLVFKYAFIAGGLTLILMNTLFIISRTRGWTPFNYIRKGINYVVGIGLCLVALFARDSSNEKMFEYQATPWPLPTLCITFFAILVLNHLPQPPPLFFGKKKKQQDMGKKEGWDAVQDMGYRSTTLGQQNSVEPLREVQISSSNATQPYGEIPDYQAAAATHQYMDQSGQYQQVNLQGQEGEQLQGQYFQGQGYEGQKKQQYQVQAYEVQPQQHQQPQQYHQTAGYERPQQQQQRQQYVAHGYEGQQQQQQQYQDVPAPLNTLGSQQRDHRYPSPYV